MKAYELSTKDLKECRANLEHMKAHRAGGIFKNEQEFLGEIIVELQERQYLTRAIVCGDRLQVILSDIDRIETSIYDQLHGIKERHPEYDVQHATRTAYGWSLTKLV